jgi:hypothetical protein
VPYVHNGELDSEAGRGPIFQAAARHELQASDHGDATHRLPIQTGVKLFIVD